MLTRVEIENFRCLRSVKLTLGPLTVLVGPNGSGKSTLLEALNFNRAGQEAFDTWRRDASLKIRRNACDDHGKPLGPAALRASRYQVLRLDLSAMRSPNQITTTPQLDQNGGNLANTFASLTRKEQAEVAQRLCELVPAFGDVDIQPIGASGSIGLRFLDRWQPNLWYGAGEVSDGTLLVLAFLLLDYQQSPPDLVAIEEPERGLHPYLIGDLVKFLRALTTGSRGRKPLQIIAATHSSELLDHLEPEEVRFLRRRAEDGSVEIQEAARDTPEWKRAYDEYQESLGSLWLSGGLGDVR